MVLAHFNSQELHNLDKIIPGRRIPGTDVKDYSADSELFKHMNAGKPMFNYSQYGTESPNAHPQAHLDGGAIASLKQLHFDTHNTPHHGTDFSHLAPVFDHPHMQNYLQGGSNMAHGGTLGSYMHHQAKQGRGGDTKLAVIPESLDRFLKHRYGGSINPTTGHREYFLGKLFDNFKSVASHGAEKLNSGIRGLTDRVGLTKAYQTPTDLQGNVPVNNPFQAKFNGTSFTGGNDYGSQLSPGKKPTDPNNPFANPSTGGDTNPFNGQRVKEQEKQNLINYNVNQNLGEQIGGIAGRAGGAALTGGNPAGVVLGQLGNKIGSAYGGPLGGAIGGLASNLAGGSTGIPGVNPMIRSTAEGIGGALGTAGGQFVDRQVNNLANQGIAKVNDLYNHASQLPNELGNAANDLSNAAIGGLRSAGNAALTGAGMLANPVGALARSGYIPLPSETANTGMPGAVNRNDALVPQSPRSSVSSQSINSNRSTRSAGVGPLARPRPAYMRGVDIDD